MEIKKIKPAVLITLLIFISTTVLGLVWFNIELLNNLFYKKCDGWGCLGFGIIYLIEYIIILAILLFFETKILLKNLVENKLVKIITTLALTILTAFIIVKIAIVLQDAQISKDTENAYTECLDMIKKANKDIRICDTYKPIK